VLGVLFIATEALQLPSERAVTMSFLTLGFAQLRHVFNMADRAAPLLRNRVTTNRWVWRALGLCAILLVAAVHLPGLSHALQTVPPTGGERGLVLGMSLAAPLLGRLAASMLPRRAVAGP